MARKPRGDAPLTVAQRSAIKRQRKAAKLDEIVSGIESAMQARTIKDAREILALTLATARSVRSA